ncbi:hypothetical protein Vafri_12928 [Volvox africanus]|uniref:Uncharacterized protein n=1 Tax=Volvox africanus TaxID=51714 RepID=A0A8J4BFK2_9CHLO|nr:hypothetical protein Vafri_12928 [Volvox africanus]
MCSQPGLNTKSSATVEAILSESIMAERLSTFGGRRYGGRNRCRQPLDAAAALRDTSAALCASQNNHYSEAWLNHVLVLSERTEPGGDDEPPSCPSPDNCRWKRIPIHMLLGVKRVALSIGLFRKHFTTWLRGRRPSCGDQQEPVVQSPSRTDVKAQQCRILDMRMELRHAKAGESLMLGLCSVNFAASPAVTTVDLLDFDDTNSIKDSLSEDGRQSADAPSFGSTADMGSTVLPLPLSLFSFSPSASSYEEQQSRPPSNVKASTWKARNLKNDLSWLYNMPCSGAINTPSFSPARPWTATAAASAPVASSGSLLDPRFASSMPAHSGTWAPPPWESEISRSVDEGFPATRCARNGHGRSNGTSPAVGHGLPASSFLAFFPELHGSAHEVELLVLDTECGADGKRGRPNDVSEWSRVCIELWPMSRLTE